MSLDVSISELPKELLDAAFNIVLVKAYEIQALAQMIVPVKTGFLRDHIQVYVLENSEGSKTISIQANAPYASIVEAKQPYLNPAVNAVAPSIEAELKTLQGSIVDNVK